MSNIASELPVEMLRCIFFFLPEIPPVAPKSWKKNVEFALAPPLPSTVTNLDDLESRRGWAKAAFICRHWRTVALSMSRIIPIRIAPEEAYKDIRSGVSTLFAPSPVVIHVEQHLLENYGFGHGHPRYVTDLWLGSTEGPRSEPMLRLISALGERVAGMYVYLSTRNSVWGQATMTPRLSDFIRFSVQLLPSFNELHLIAPGRNHRHGTISSSRYTMDGVLDMPGHLLGDRALSVLELRDCHLANPESIFPHTNLRRLTLVASTDSWPLPLTTNLKMLEYLCLTLESIPKKSTIASMDTIELPTLKHLHLGGYMYNVGTLLGKLSFPASTMIVLRCDYNANTVDEYVCPLVAPLAEHLEGSCTQGAGFTNVTLRVGELDAEIICSAPISCGSSSLLSPSTSITVGLACRLHRGSPMLGHNYTTAIFEDLIEGVCARLPHTSLSEQTLEVTVSSSEALGLQYGYWIKAVSSALRDVTEIRLDFNTARHLLDFIQSRRAQRGDLPFPHLRRFTLVPGHFEDGYSEKMFRYLHEELKNRGVDGAVFFGGPRFY